MNTARRPILDMNAFDPRNLLDGASGLLARRLDNLGASSVLFYREPIELVSASGAWMHAADGTHYLDFYNNVPSIGHCHPCVTAAISAQLGRLNINTRYLNTVVDDYLESLKHRLPDALSNVALTCSGSEANDLAMRVAMKVSGRRGFIVTESAYHGNTSAVTDISPSALKGGALPDHVVAVPAPATVHHGEHIGDGFARSIDTAALELETRGHGVAAFVGDSIFSSDGVFAEPAGFLAAAVETVQRHGGLYIADEVQPGFARTGRFWGFEHHGIQPDIVTMGKPMGNGYPLAGMALRPAMLEAFCEDVGYFNTFGGSPVAAAAGQAVLDVIDDEGLLQQSASIGAHLLERLQGIACATQTITEVRGQGLFIGIELCDGGDPVRPDAELASRWINALKDEQVLIGAAGRHGNVLKVRPPLCLSLEEADLFADAVSRVARRT